MTKLSAGYKIIEKSIKTILQITLSGFIKEIKMIAFLESGYKKGFTVFIFAVLLFFFAGFQAAAQDSGIGAGIILGEPTGLNAKMWISDKAAVDAALAWSFYRRDGDRTDSDGALYIHVNFLYHFFDIINISKGNLVFYTGAGGKMALANDFYLGIRIPLGLTYMFENIPLDIFFELSPSLVLVPGSDFDIGGGLGARFWFGG